MLRNIWYVLLYSCINIRNKFLLQVIGYLEIILVLIEMVVIYLFLVLLKLNCEVF